MTWVASQKTSSKQSWLPALIPTEGCSNPRPTAAATLPPLPVRVGPPARLSLRRSHHSSHSCRLGLSLPGPPCLPAERLDGGLAALETLGLVLGRALYEGVLLDLPLAPFFVARLQGRHPQ